MANYEEPNLDELYNRMEHLHEKFENKELIDNELSKMKEIYEEISPNTEEDKIIGNLLYESIKMFFEMGFELAKNLNLELVFDQFEKAEKE